MNTREATCPWCQRSVQVRSSELHIKHLDRWTGIACVYSGGLSDLPDLRSKPVLSRVDVIRARSKAVR